MGVVGDVVEGVLDDAVDGDFDGVGQAVFDAGDGEVDFGFVLFGPLADVLAEGFFEAEVVEDHGAEVEDEAAGVLKGGADEGFEGGEFGAGAGGVHVHGAFADFGAEDEVGHGLGGAVVEGAGDAEAFVFLGLDDAGGDFLGVASRPRLSARAARLVEVMGRPGMKPSGAWLRISRVWARAPWRALMVALRDWSWSIWERIMKRRIWISWPLV